MDDVDLAVIGGGRDPLRAHRGAACPGDIDHAATRRPARVGVVEHDPTLSGDEQPVELGEQIVESPAAFVAVQADVAAVHIGGHAGGLAGTRTADDHHHIAVR